MLLQYEFNKIVHKKRNLIAMLVGYIILGITTIYPIMNETVDICKTDTTYQGMEAIQYNQELAAKQTDKLTEEYVNGDFPYISGSGTASGYEKGVCKKSNTVIEKNFAAVSFFTIRTGNIMVKSNQ